MKSILLIKSVFFVKRIGTEKRYFILLKRKGKSWISLLGFWKEKYLILSRSIWVVSTVLSVAARLSKSQNCGIWKRTRVFCRRLPLFEPSARVNIPSGGRNERGGSQPRSESAPLTKDPNLTYCLKKLSLPRARAGWGSWTRAEIWASAVSRRPGDMTSPPSLLMATRGNIYIIRNTKLHGYDFLTCWGESSQRLLKIC